jgi:2-polyprenyl-3-methyl-5-hydroxy-6-metoxy-1,4-benzoquinol methylase
LGTRHPDVPAISVSAHLAIGHAIISHPSWKMGPTLLVPRLLAFASRSRMSAGLLHYQPPSDLRQNWLTVSPEGEARIVESLKRHYFTRRIYQDATPGVDEWLRAPDGRADLAEHLWIRTDCVRRTITPWLNDARPLAGARILEIGCGTGASTVALAEQGAQVTAVDLDEPSLCVADDRLRVYGCGVELQLLNATEVSRQYAGREFDFIVFVATVEHMLRGERIRAIRGTWEMLAPGGLWCLADTPNRLWCFDGHTSWLPFYHWLPDDLALAYSRYSSREPFASSYGNAMPDAAEPGTPSDSDMESFLRHGRGVSYHEFALAMGDVETLDVVSSLPIWLRERSPLHVRRLARGIQSHGKFSRMLSAVGPPIHPGFYEPNLELIIRKDGRRQKAAGQPAADGVPEPEPQR